MTLQQFESEESTLLIRLTNDLENISTYIDEDSDIRVQLEWYESTHDYGYTIHLGDASYDTNHNGYWGSDVIFPNMGKEDIKTLAQELLNQCADSLAQSSV